MIDWGNVGPSNSPSPGTGPLPLPSGSPGSPGSTPVTPVPVTGQGSPGVNLFDGNLSAEEGAMTREQVDALGLGGQIARGADMVGEYLFGEESALHDTPAGDIAKFGGDLAVTLGKTALKPFEIGAGILHAIPTGTADETFRKIGEVAAKNDPELFAKWLAVDAAAQGWHAGNMRAEFNNEALAYLEHQRFDSYGGYAPNYGLATAGSVGDLLGDAVGYWLGVAGGGVQKALGHAGAFDPGGIKIDFDKAKEIYTKDAANGVVKSDKSSLPPDTYFAMKQLAEGKFTEEEAREYIASKVGRNRLEEIGDRFDRGDKVNETELQALLAYRGGEWSLNHAEDFLINRGSGITNDPLGQIIGSVVTDPLFWGSLGAGALSQTGKVGLAAKNLDPAMLTQFQRLAVSVRALQEVTGPLGKGTYGGAFRFARGLIDPFAVYRPKSAAQAVIDLKAATGLVAFRRSYGPSAHNTIRALGREFDMVDEVDSAIASYTVDQSNLMIARTAQRRVLEEGLGEEAVLASVDDVIKPLSQFAGRDAVTELVDHMTALAKNTFTEDELIAILPGRLAAMFGKDPEFWAKRVSVWDHDTRSAAHAVTYKHTEVGFMEARALVDDTAYKGDAPIRNMVLLTTEQLDNESAEAILENLEAILKLPEGEGSVIDLGTSEWNRLARKYPTMATIGYAPGGRSQLRGLMRELRKKLDDGGIHKRMTIAELDDPALKPIKDFVDRHTVVVAIPPKTPPKGRVISSHDEAILVREGRELLNDIQAQPATPTPLTDPTTPEFVALATKARAGVETSPSRPNGWGGATFDAHTGAEVKADFLYHRSVVGNRASIERAGITQGDYSADFADPLSTSVGQGRPVDVYRIRAGRQQGGQELSPGWWRNSRSRVADLEVLKHGETKWTPLSGVKPGDGPFTGAIGKKGQSSIPIAAADDADAFNEGLSKFVTENKEELERAGHQIGVFRNEETKLVEFDVVYTVPKLRDAEAIQLVVSEKQTGGWFNQWDGVEGDGVYRPEVDPALPAVLTPGDYGNLPAAADEGFVYHVTGTQRMYNIADEGLTPHTPDYRGEQTLWPDGSSAARSYFSEDAASTRPFSNIDDGSPVILRVSETSGTKIDSTAAVAEHEAKIVKYKADLAEWKKADAEWDAKAQAEAKAQADAATTVDAKAQADYDAAKAGYDDAVEAIENDTPPPLVTFATRWDGARKNNRAMEKDLERLKDEGFDVSEAEDLLSDYDGLERSDFSNQAEFQEAKDEAWQEVIDSVAAADPQDWIDNAIAALGDEPIPPVPGAAQAAAAGPVETPPFAAGEAPLEPGMIRAYHYTSPDALTAIRKEGLLRSKAKGDTYGEPNAIWFSTKKPDGDRAFVEVHLRPEELADGAPFKRLGEDEAQWQKRIDDFNANGGNFNLLADEVPPDRIVTYNEDWMHEYRTLAKDATSDPVAFRKEFGWALEGKWIDTSTGRAVQKRLDELEFVAAKPGGAAPASSLGPRPVKPGPVGPPPDPNATSRFAKERGTGDIVTEETIAPEDIEYLRNDGKWSPIKETPVKRPPTSAEPPDGPGPRPLWRVGFRPDEEVAWGLKRDHATGAYVPDRDPTISHVVNATPGRVPFSDTTRNVLGQVIGKSRAERLNKPIESIEAMVNTMSDMVTGRRLVNNTERRFERLMFDGGIPIPITKAIWAKARDVAGLEMTTVKGIRPDNLWNAIHDIIPRNLRWANGDTVNIHDIMDRLLIAAEGDLRIMGLANVMTQRMRNALMKHGYNPGNWVGTMTITMYNKLRYSQPTFIIQRIGDAPYYSILYGIKPVGKGKLTGGAADMQAITDNLGATQTARDFSIDQSEYATRSNFTAGIKSALQDAGVRDSWRQKIVDAPDIIIANNMANMLHARAGEIVRGVLDNLATAAKEGDPALRAEMLENAEQFARTFEDWRVVYSNNAGRMLDDNEVGLQFIKDQLNAWRRHVVKADGQLDTQKLIHEGERAMPDDIGAIGPIRPDALAQELGYADSAALRRDVTGHIEVIDGQPILRPGEHDLAWLEEHLRETIMANKDYTRRVMAYYGGTWGGFWNDLARTIDDGGLDISPHFAAEAQAVIAQIAKSRDMDPWEYLSGVMVSNLGTQNLNDSIVQLMSFLKAGSHKQPLEEWTRLYRMFLEPSAQEVMLREFEKAIPNVEEALLKASKAPGLFGRAPDGKVTSMPKGFAVEPGYVYRTDVLDKMRGGWRKGEGVSTDGGPNGQLRFQAQGRPGEGVFRAKMDPSELKVGRNAQHQPGGKDNLTIDDVPPERIEMLADDGTWVPLGEDPMVQIMSKQFPEALNARAASGVPHPNPEVEAYMQAFSKWVQDVISPELAGRTRSDLRRLVEAVPTTHASTFNRSQHLMVSLLKNKIEDARQDIFRLAEMQTQRSVLERSFNHPVFAVYPASYMWGKVLPETVKFLARNPYGATYAIGDVQRSIAIQREYDSDMESKMNTIDRSSAAFLLDYLTPGLPWNAHEARMSPLIRKLLQGKPEDIWLAELNTVSPTRWISQIADTVKEAIDFTNDALEGDNDAPTRAITNLLEISTPIANGGGGTGQITGPISASALAPILLDDLSRMQSILLEGASPEE